MEEGGGWGARDRGVDEEDAECGIDYEEWKKERCVNQSLSLQAQGDLE